MALSYISPGRIVATSSSKHIAGSVAERLKLKSGVRQQGRSAPCVGTCDLPSVLGNLDLTELQPLDGIDKIDERSAKFLPGRRYIDAGNLKNARTIERMTLLSGEMGQRYGFFPRMNYQLLGDHWKPGSADAIGPLIARD